MHILSWNIQSGLGCDGVRDLNRIVNYLGKQMPADVICLQEIARFIPQHTSSGQEDQLTVITNAMDSYSSIWGTGIRWYQAGKPHQEFGNLTLIRGKILNSRVHCLPLPAGAGNYQLPRVAVETVIANDNEELRIINTHLAYHSATERKMQLAYLNQWQKWQEENLRQPAKTGDGCYAGKYQTAQTVICGDLNFEPEDDDYRSMKDSGWDDGWMSPNASSIQTTCGVFDQNMWPQGPHCRDYFWLSKGLADRIKAVSVDTACPFSDHQPITIHL